MNSNTTVVVAFVCVVVLVIILAVLFRKSLKLKLRAFGLDFAAEGKSSPPTSRGTVTASGDRAAAVGGSFEGEITTGDSREAVRKGQKSAIIDAKSSPARLNPEPAPKPQSSAAGIVTASGTRSAAVAGGVRGKITTGDRINR
jgi:hypothetical protein